MLRIGFLLGFTAVLLQIAVFLQPLLPKQFQIAPVCETITRALFKPLSNEPTHKHASDVYDPLINQKVTSDQHPHINDVSDQYQHASHHHVKDERSAPTHFDSSDPLSHQVSAHSEHHHDANHQCQYCTVFGNLVLPPELSLAVVIDRIQVRLLAFEKAFKHVYFQLQRLYLLPQGRAPPLFT